MAKKTDIQTFEYTISTENGAETVYEVKVIDPKTGAIKKSLVTKDYKEASEYYAAVSKEHPNATVNGGPMPKDAPLSSSHPSFDGTPSPGSSDKVPSSSPGPETQAPNPRGASGTPFSGRNNSFTANTKKKPVDCSGLPKGQRKICELPKEEKVDRGISGVFGTKRIQAQVNRVDCESENIVGRGPDNNAFIVIGNDRPKSKQSGYGGKGHTQCDSIDIVAGMGSFAPEQYSAALDSKVWTNPNFLLDAARIYISQKTDVDKNFEIGTKEGMQSKSEAKSAIAIKADNIRLIGRESLVLATNTDSFNSQGGQIQAWSGIHLMANNDEAGLQPIPVGNNLSQAIFELSKHLESLGKIFHGYLKYQMKYNQAIAKHKHISPFFGKPTTPSPECQQGGLLVDVEHISKTELSILKQLTNLSGYRNNYLTRKGKNYINSRFNMTN